MMMMQVIELRLRPADLKKENILFFPLRWALRDKGYFTLTVYIQKKHFVAQVDTNAEQYEFLQRPDEMIDQSLASLDELPETNRH